MRQYRETVKWMDKNKIHEKLFAYARREFPELYNEKTKQELPIEKGRLPSKKYVDEMFKDWDRNVKPEKMEEVLEHYQKKGANLGGLEALRKLGIGMAFNLRDPLVLDALLQRGKKITGKITATTLYKFQDALIDSYMEKGMYPADVKKRIKDMFAKTYKNRAWTIARTETGIAHSTVHHEAYERNMVRYKKWRSKRDAATRPSHLQADVSSHAKPVPIDKPFSNGLMHPLDSNASAAEVVNCRCAEIPVVGKVNYCKSADGSCSIPVVSIINFCKAKGQTKCCVPWTGGPKGSAQDEMQRWMQGKMTDGDLRGLKEALSLKGGVIDSQGGLVEMLSEMGQFFHGYMKYRPRFVKGMQASIDDVIKGWNRGDAQARNLLRAYSQKRHGGTITWDGDEFLDHAKDKAETLKKSVQKYRSSLAKGHKIKGSQFDDAMDFVLEYNRRVNDFMFPETMQMYRGTLLGDMNVGSLGEAAAMKGNSIVGNVCSSWVRTRKTAAAFVKNNPLDGVILQGQVARGQIIMSPYGGIGPGGNVQEFLLTQEPVKVTKLYNYKQKALKIPKTPPKTPKVEEKTPADLGSEAARAENMKRPKRGKGSQKDWERSLSDDERDAIYEWTGDSDPFIAWQREGAKGFDDWEDDMMRTFFHALDRAPADTHGVLYRGLHNLSPSQVKKITSAKTMTLANHQSASYSHDAAEQFLLGRYGGKRDIMFRIKGNKTGVDIHELSDIYAEYEVVLKKGAQYKITGVKPPTARRKYWILDMVEI